MNSDSRTADGVRRLVLGTASLLLGILAWWAISRRVPDYVLPGPSQVVGFFWAQWTTGGLPLNIAETLGEILQGSLIGLAVGMVLAFLLHRFSLVRRILMPLVVIVQVTPKISIAPLVVLWIGLGVGSKIFLVALVVFYPILVNVMGKLDALPASFDELCVVTGIGGLKRVWAIELPYVLPDLCAGLRLGLVQAVTATVIGDFIGAERGLGYLAKLGQTNSNIQMVLMALILLSLIGWALYAIVGFVERRLTARFA